VSRAHPTPRTDRPSIESYLDKYISEGLLPIPLKPGSKEPKLPKTKSLLKYIEQARNHPDKVRQLFLENCQGDCNVGLLLYTATGEKLIVVDVDDSNMVKIVIDVIKKCRLPYDVPIVKTRRGYHFYFVTNSDCKNRRIASIDIKCHHYVVAPPSVVEGKRYEFVKHDKGAFDFSELVYAFITQDDIKCMIEQLVKATKQTDKEEKQTKKTEEKQARKVKKKEAERIFNILRKIYVPGRRNEILHALVGCLYRNGWSEEEILDVVKLFAEYEKNQPDAEPEKRISDAQNTIRWCKTDTNRKCPSFKKLKEVVGSLLSKAEWKELLNAIAGNNKKDKKKAFKYIIEKSPSKEKAIIANEHGIKLVTFSASIKKGKTISNKKSLSSIGIINISRAELTQINNSDYYKITIVEGGRRKTYVVNELLLSEFISKKLSISQYYRSDIANLIRFNAKRKSSGWFVSGVVPTNDGYDLRPFSELWMGADNEASWSLPKIEPADSDTTMKILKTIRKRFRFDESVEAIAWTLTALARPILIKRWKINVPFLALIGPQDTGKSVLAGWLKQMFDLRDGSGQTEPQLRRTITASAVPFIIEETMPVEGEYTRWVETIKKTVGAGGDLLITQIDYRNQYAGHYIANSVGLFTFNTFSLIRNRDSSLLDKIAVIFIDELSDKERVDLDESVLPHVGRRLLDEYLNELINTDLVRSGTRIEKYLSAFKIAKRTVCKYVGCLEEPLNLALGSYGLPLNGTNNVHKFRQFIMHRVFVEGLDSRLGVNVCGTIKGLTRLGARRVHRLSSVADYFGLEYPLSPRYRLFCQFIDI